MRRDYLRSLLLVAFLVSVSSLLIAQDQWREVPVESSEDHQPLPFIKAIGIPATATYRGEKHKAVVIISGRTKATGGPGQPVIEVHIDGIHDLISEEDLEMFEGPPESEVQNNIRAFSISIVRGKHVYRATTWVGDFYIGNYPESIVGKVENNVFSTVILSRGPLRASWAQLLREMSSGFDEGHISIGGKVLSPNVEINFSGNGIQPLLKELIRVVGP